MKQKICVAMSGGVDSSVAAALLVDQGYEVIGAFMKNWSQAQEGVMYKPWENEARDAEDVCKQLGIPFHVFDFENEYKDRVVNAFVREYQQGRTPNPDVLCNKEVKFDLFLNAAKELGADAIATGHYAQIIAHHDLFELHKARDPEKDQSYFLYTLTQKELAHILFPIGHLLKSEVRQLAHNYHLQNAAKKDSQGICFIGPVSMRKFLQRYITTKPGNVINHEGRIIGQHDGVMYYTEGQRHGFDTSGSHEPLYVAEKRLKSNELLVAPSGHFSLSTESVRLEQVTWTDLVPDMPCVVDARVRYRQQLHQATLNYSDDKLVMRFYQPIESVSLGQSAVFYVDNTVIGGAIISGRDTVENR